jgi:hypothetical protein
LASLSAAQVASSTAPPNTDLLTELRALREEIAGMRSDNNNGHATTAGNTSAIKRTLDDAAGGGAPLAVTVEKAA